MRGNHTQSLPEQGQLVEVRRRQWVVAEVTGSALSRVPRTGNGSQPHHLVTLSSIDEDALGEEIQVVWEIEPGARILEKAGLPEPTGFDDPVRLDAFLDAVRWGAATNADVQALQSPFRSGIAIEDYQLDPVARSLQMPRVNLLIADDVGLGKTVETGLVVQELLLRHRARTVLVVLPRPRGSDRLMVVKSHTNTTSAEDGPDARGMLPAMAALPLRGELVDKGGEKE